MPTVDNDILKAMYEYSINANEKGEQYVVRGAELWCGYGDTACPLNLPATHGVETADKRPLITYSDSRPSNVATFGTCKVLNAPCAPILGNWSYNSDSKNIYNQVSKKTEKAVTRSATAECKNVKVIDALKNKDHSPTPRVIITTSGQVIADYTGKKDGAVEVTEDQRTAWKRASNNAGDFYGHIKIEHSGVYNIHIYTESNANGGSLFLYRKSKLKGTYNLEKMTDGLTANLVLEKQTDYYIEVDCINLDHFEYLLCGNQEADFLNGTYTGNSATRNTRAAIWLLDGKFKSEYGDAYEKNRKENTSGVTTAILYLHDNYRDLFKDCIQYQDATYAKRAEKISNKFIANAISAITLLMSASKHLSLASTVASAFTLLYSCLPESDAIALSKELAYYETQNVIITFHDNSIPNASTYYHDNQLAEIFRDNYPYTVELFSQFQLDGITQVLGEKYLMGKITLYNEYQYTQRAAVLKDMAPCFAYIEENMSDQ